MTSSMNKERKDRKFDCKDCGKQFDYVSPRVRTNTKFSNEPSTEYVFENQICTNRVPSNYSFRKNYSNSIRVPKTTRIVRKNE